MEPTSSTPPRPLKDAADLIALAGRLGLLAATPDDLGAHIRSHYTNQADLEFIVDGTDVDRGVPMSIAASMTSLGGGRRRVALRVLKRRLSSIVRRTMLDDTVAHS